MRLKDIEGVEHYLENDCYCRHEIYDGGGFFYKLFEPSKECKYLGTKKDYYHIAICENQILVFYFDDSAKKVVDSVRYDATENNIKICMELIKGKEANTLGKLNKFSKNDSENDLKKILSFTDAIMISN